MTNTESIFHTMRILRAPPIPTQKIEAPTLEQLNAANPERRAIALGALVVGPVGLLFALICFIAMPPPPPSAAEVARANHILTVADGPGEATPAVALEEQRRRNPWLPDNDPAQLSPTEAARYTPPAGASSSKKGGGVASDGTDPYSGIEIWPAGAGTHTRPEGHEKPIVVFERKDAEKKDERRKDTRTVPARPVEVAKVPEPKSSEPKVLHGTERSGSVRPKELRAVSEPAPKKQPTTPAGNVAPAPAPAPRQPSKLDPDDDLKKPTLD